MAGTLTISTLSDGTNSTSSTNCIQGSAKAWVNFNGTGTPAIRGSYNVSSITDNGTGDYTINFTNAFANTNYAAFASGGNGSSASKVTLDIPIATPTTSAIRVYATNYLGNAGDYAYIYISVFGS